MNKEDVFFVKKIYELSKKLNKNIKISNKDEAANLYAYMKGYTSWMEMVFFENNVSNGIIEEHSNILDVRNKEFKDKIWLFDNSFVKMLEKDNTKLKEFDFIAKTNLLQNYSIGTYESLKSNLIISLDVENALISGMNNENTFNFFEKEIENIIKWDKSVIICGLSTADNRHRNILKKLKENEAVFIGKSQKLKINPFLDLFRQDTFEDFFNEDNLEDNIFTDIWINVIRIYKEQLGLKITPRFLKDSLKIENLIQMMTGLEKNIQLQMKPLINYINKYLEINYIKEKQTFLITELAQEKHYKQSYLIEKKIYDLIKLYENNVFDIDSEISLFDIFKNKKAIVLLDINNECKNTYWSILMNLFNTILKEQHLFVEKSMMPEDIFHIPVIMWNGFDILNEKTVKILLEHKEYLKCHLYDIAPEINTYSIEKTRSLFLKDICQVLFLRQNIEKINSTLEERIKENTLTWNVNLFYMKFNILRNLNDNEAIFWQNDKNERVLKNLEDYVLRKIKLKED